VARPLKTFAKQLDGRVAQAREIPLLLSELSSLQGQALNNLEPDGETTRPGPGLLQRLFGSKEAASEAPPVDAEPLPAAQSAPPTPAAPKPTPKPEEPGQSEELTQALRAFAPLPPLKPVPVAVAEVQEVASETPVFDAPELPSIAAPAQLPEPDVQAPPVAEPAQESAIAAFIE
ncbi:hypothetical protein CAY91_34575, partial [Pseudomonas aeruginosa]